MGLARSQVAVDWQLSAQGHDDRGEAFRDHNPFGETVNISMQDDFKHDSRPLPSITEDPLIARPPKVKRWINTTIGCIAQANNNL